MKDVGKAVGKVEMWAIEKERQTAKWKVGGRVAARVLRMEQETAPHLAWNKVVCLGCEKVCQQAGGLALWLAAH